MANSLYISGSSSSSIVGAFWRQQTDGQADTPPLHGRIAAEISQTAQRVSKVQLHLLPEDFNLFRRCYLAESSTDIIGRKRFFPVQNAQRAFNAYQRGLPITRCRSEASLA